MDLQGYTSSHTGITTSKFHILGDTKKAIKTIKKSANDLKNVEVPWKHQIH